MCGFIAAFTEKTFLKEWADAALRQLSPRGPDGEGRWQCEGAFLGHRRLAILDLDLRAGQPMQSHCGRYVIVFNGEIYNFRQLRRELEHLGECFLTTSDTEVLLSLFVRYRESMLSRLKGMFSFVIWDINERSAFAARDAYGIKPLYLAKVQGGLVFASQVKALLATGIVDRAPNLSGQLGFWMLGSVPEPHTWYRDIECIQAGHCLWIKFGRVISRRLWCDNTAVWREAAQYDASRISGPEILDAVRCALTESVDRHLVSDVPVGVFLSGGIDSGAVAALMHERGSTPLLGITIAYDEYQGSQEDEAPMASLIARHFGIRHHIRRVRCEEFFSDLPRILAAMDQPSIDGINTWYAAKAAAEQGLKVVVSGVGGDELFLGYESFRRLPRLLGAWRTASHLPGVPAFAAAIAEMQARRSGEARWRHAAAWLGQGIAGAWWLHRSVLAPERAEVKIGAAVARGFTPERWIADMAGPLAVDDILALAQIESSTYLRNQLLRDSDWASMDHGVELRTPLVDTTLLLTMKPYLSRFHLYPKKTLLAEAPVRPLPNPISRRRKTGFSIPVKQWIAKKFGRQRSWQAEVVARFEGVAK